MSNEFAFLYLHNLCKDLVKRIDQLDKKLEEAGCDQFLTRGFYDNIVSGKKLFSRLMC